MNIHRKQPLGWLQGWDIWILVVGLIVLAFMVSCAHFPVHPGECPYLSGYGTEYVLSAEDPQCKMRCLQEFAFDCARYGPTPQ